MNFIKYHIECLCSWIVTGEYRIPKKEHWKIIYPKYDPWKEVTMTILDDMDKRNGKVPEPSSGSKIIK